MMPVCKVKAFVGEDRLSRIYEPTNLTQSEVTPSWLLKRNDPDVKAMHYLVAPVTFYVTVSKRGYCIVSPLYGSHQLLVRVIACSDLT